MVDLVNIPSPIRPPHGMGEAPRNPSYRGGEEKAERFDFIDKAKAIGILLVVLGHVPGMPEPWVTVIYGFHMPLFFLLSGFLLSHRKLGLGFRAYFGHLLRGLGLPYLGFFALSYTYWLATRHIGGRAAKFAGVEWSDPLHGFVTGLGSEMVVNPTLWFFPCLFTTAWLYYLSRKVLGAFDALLVFAALGVVASVLMGFLPGRLPWGLDNAWVALVFYALGQSLRGIAPAVSACVADYPLTALVVGTYLVGGTAVLSEMAGRVDLNFANFGDSPGLYFPTALCGIAAVLALAHALPSNALCGWLSRNTLLIFPTHPLVINFLSGLGKLVFKLPEAFFITAAFGLAAGLVSILVCVLISWLASLCGSGLQPTIQQFCRGLKPTPTSTPTPTGAGLGDG
ncbi:acyltransferase family protein [Methylomagnum sp.]